MPLRRGGSLEREGLRNANLSSVQIANPSCRWTRRSGHGNMCETLRGCVHASSSVDPLLFWLLPGIAKFSAVFFERSLRRWSLERFSRLPTVQAERMMNVGLLYYTVTCYRENASLSMFRGLTASASRCSCRTGFQATMTVAHGHCHSSYLYHAISNAGHNICSLLVTTSTRSLARVFGHRLAASTWSLRKPARSTSQTTQRATIGESGDRVHRCRIRCGICT